MQTVVNRFNMKEQLLALVSELNFLTIISLTTAFITVALFNLAIF
jgi:hypothetical protein